MRSLLGILLLCSNIGLAGNAKTSVEYEFDDGARVFLKLKKSGDISGLSIIKAGRKNRRRIGLEGHLDAISLPGAQMKGHGALYTQVNNLYPHNQLQIDFMILVIDREIVTLTSDGTLHRSGFKVPKKFLKSAEQHFFGKRFRRQGVSYIAVLPTVLDPSAQTSSASTAKSGSSPYHLTPPKATDASDEDSASETYEFVLLVREDGRIVKMPVYPGLQSVEDELKVEIDELGVLRTEAVSPRAVDLNAFDIEADFDSAPLRLISDAEGNFVSPLTLLDEQFDRVTEANTGSYPALGNDEMHELRRALAKKHVGSVVVIGPSGSGKTEKALRFVQNVLRGEYPEIPRTIRIYNPSVSSLSAGTKYASAFETRIEALTAVSDALPTLILVDEIHTARGQGTHESDPNDIFDKVKGPMRRGSLRFIGTSTEEEFDEAFAGNKALYNRFRKVMQTIPGHKETVAALRNFLDRFGYPVPDSAVLDAVVDLSGQFDPINVNPGKAVNLLDEAIGAQVVKSAGTSRSIPLTMKDIKAAASSLYGVNPARFDAKTRSQRLADFEAALDRGIVGLKDQKKMLVDLERQAEAGVADEGRPRTRVLFAGPKGTGKTELAKIYGAALGVPVIIVEMTRYQAHTSPDEFLDEIAKGLREHPFAVFLLDEAEKAHPQIQVALLNLLNDGTFTTVGKLTAGNQAKSYQKLSATNARFILTTNAGEDFDRKTSISFYTGKDTSAVASFAGLDPLVLEMIVADGLDEKMVDRMQGVALFRQPNKRKYREIVRFHVKNFIDQHSDKAPNTAAAARRATDTIVEDIVKKTYSGNASARDVLRGVQNELRQKFALAILEGDAKSCAASFFGNR